ncbi:hypothetical protein CANCADRAFT_1725 [Tortispora caseinolytica NRRL Y-17796]|uniref:Uncharacterized protein n=1 Tax=Tortispora caseinolytica NRRL Y-17796 TaxID=767744 RepID=A0A1E4TE15_9ASCO|nr:hypothetical protein CANCADRAFT_1725 [Tortispora caseinolytica NRRL Y-17796]
MSTSSTDQDGQLMEIKALLELLLNIIDRAPYLDDCQNDNCLIASDNLDTLLQFSEDSIFLTSDQLSSRVVQLYNEFFHDYSSEFMQIPKSTLKKVEHVCLSLIKHLERTDVPMQASTPVDREAKNIKASPSNTTTDWSSICTPASPTKNRTSLFKYQQRCETVQDSTQSSTNSQDHGYSSHSAPDPVTEIMFSPNTSTSSEESLRRRQNQMNIIILETEEKLAQCEEELEELRIKHSATMKENHSMRDKVNSLESMLADMTTEMQSKEEEVLELNDQVSKLKEDKGKYSVHCDSLQASISKQWEYIDELERTKEKLGKHIETLESLDMISEANSSMREDEKDKKNEEIDNDDRDEHMTVSTDHESEIMNVIDIMRPRRGSDNGLNWYDEQSEHDEKHNVAMHGSVWLKGVHWKIIMLLMMAIIAWNSANYKTYTYRNDQTRSITETEAELHAQLERDAVANVVGKIEGHDIVVPDRYDKFVISDSQSLSSAPSNGTSQQMIENHNNSNLKAMQKKTSPEYLAKLRALTSKTLKRSQMPETLQTLAAVFSEEINRDEGKQESASAAFAYSAYLASVHAVRADAEELRAKAADCWKKGYIKSTENEQVTYETEMNHFKKDTQLLEHVSSIESDIPVIETRTRRKSRRPPPDLTDLWVCDFCQYEMIYGRPPHSFLRAYEIAERKERKRELGRQRITSESRWMEYDPIEGSDPQAMHADAVKPRYTISHISTREALIIPTTVLNVVQDAFEEEKSKENLTYSTEALDEAVKVLQQHRYPRLTSPL